MRLTLQHNPVRVNNLFREISAEFNSSVLFQFTLLVILSLMHGLRATIDLSNLDLKNYRFFRYVKMLPNGEMINTAPPPPSLSDHLKRVKAGKFAFIYVVRENNFIISAVGTYVREVAFGNGGNPNIPIAFHPSVEHLRDNFQRKYGHRGWWLIEQLGNGSFRDSSRFTPRWGKKYRRSIDQ